MSFSSPFPLFFPILLEIGSTSSSLRRTPLNLAMGLGSDVSFPSGVWAEPLTTTQFCAKTHLMAVVLPLCYAVRIIKLGQNAKNGGILCPESAYRVYYLRQGSYVSSGVCLFLCLFVCLQLLVKALIRSSRKFYQRCIFGHCSLFTIAPATFPAAVACSGRELYYSCTGSL